METIDAADALDSSVVEEIASGIARGSRVPSVCCITLACFSFEIVVVVFDDDLC